MTKPSTLTLFCSLAALPLIGCANGVGPQSQAYSTVAPVAAAPSGERVYAPGPGGPAAILVMLPSPGDVLTGDPALWAAQGFDVVALPPSEIYQLAADREAAFDRLIASVQALADAPIWLVGPNPAIESAIASMPRSGPGEVSGVVVTSMASGAGMCRERMIYSYSGNGAPPKVSVGKSGDCPAGSAFGSVGGSPKRTTGDRAAAPIDRGSRTAVQQVAELIKSARQD
jgi:hypothetical protein